MSFFHRLKTVAKSYMIKDNKKWQRMKDDTEKTMRELQTKIDTYQMKIQQAAQEIISQQAKVNKLARYQEKADQPEQKQQFALQQQQAEQEIKQLEQRKSQLEQSLAPYQHRFQQIDQDFAETLAYIQAMEAEAASKQQEAETIQQLQQYEDKVRRQLAEAEALLELRNSR
ncbi:hypothetical protein [Gracilibacillus timonensis]|uniref:hypothetical protein n=1 Tax=Gracilibacillus timonensis TaxID=1816696 RepID=UPI00082587BB|nr:hypothetical protein [Gracilibacillus timonensis]